MAAAAAGLDHLNRERVEGESGIISHEKKITIVALAALVAGIVLMALFPPPLIHPFLCGHRSWRPLHGFSWDGSLSCAAQEPYKRRGRRGISNPHQ